MKNELSLKYQVPSVEDACRVLQAVCASSDSLSLAELVKVAESSRTTVLRIASSLCNNGFLERQADGRYVVGDTMRVIGSRVQNDSSLRSRAIPILQELARATGETTHLAIPLKAHCLLQEVVDSPQLVRVASRPGTLVDYHCSVTGKSILASRPDLCSELREVSLLRQHTVHTITSWEALDLELAKVRKKGYAVDNEEYHLGVRCVGAPVRDKDGNVIGAIGVTATTTRLAKRDLPAVAKLVMECVQQLQA